MGGNVCLPACLPVCLTVSRSLQTPFPPIIPLFSLAVCHTHKHCHARADPPAQPHARTRARTDSNIHTYAQIDTNSHKFTNSDLTPSLHQPPIFVQNPAHETQAAVRAYRMGQKNPVFVYRLIAVGTMENFVYDRQVNKSQLSKSVVDDTNVTRLFSSRDLEELFRLEHPPPIPEQEVRESSVACVAITDAQACQVDAYAPKLDVSAKNVIEGKGLQGELLEGGGDKVIASVLRGPRKNWVVKVKRHEDAVEEDNSEELTKEEEELALQEEAEEEERTKRGSLSQLPASSHVVPPPPPLLDLPPGWEMARDANTGREYFFNRRENKSQWERPHVAPLPLAGLAFQQAQQLQQMLQSQQQVRWLQCI